MRTHHAYRLLSIIAIAALAFWFGCSKKNGPTESTAPARVQTYAVSMTVLNPLGTPQGGATVSLVNPPYPTGTYADQPFDATTDTAGKATIQSPVGAQTITAKIGTLFQAQATVNVTASTTPISAGQVRLSQNTTMKVLVVQADCETLEDVLTAIGFTSFDLTYIDTLRDRANNDSTATLNALKKYSYVFSDCHCSTEEGSEYARLSRVYGRYVAAGGKMYGGHYNYFHLQRIWAPKYQTAYSGTATGSADSIQILNTALSAATGYTVAAWSTYGSLRSYDMFSDIPGSSTVYAVLKNSTPQGAVIVVNYTGSGKYVWTNYHNQDVEGNPKLLKLIQFFLWSM